MNTYMDTVGFNLNQYMQIKSVAEFWRCEGNVWGMCLPKKSIYHYTSSVKTVENILSTGELWLSKSNVMNDFLEIEYGCDLLRKVLEEEREKEPFVNNILESFDKAVENKIFGDIFVLSFSENENSRLLWDSYARKNGYNIEFSRELISDFINNTPEQVKVFKENGWVTEDKGFKVDLKTKKDEYTIPGFSYSTMANSVLYDPSAQIQIFRDIIDYVIDLKDEKKLDTQIKINQALTSLIDFIPFFKDPSLINEEEYRLVVKIKEVQPNNRGKKEYLRNVQCYREVDNKLFPYIVLKMHDMRYIKSVCLGYCNCNELSFNTLEDFISTLYFDVEIKKAKFSLRF